jgi:hypothetical protein
MATTRLQCGDQKTSVTTLGQADRCVCDDRISHIQEQTPNMAHPPAELLSASRAGDKVTSRVKIINERPDAGPCSPIV